MSGWFENDACARKCSGMFGKNEHKSASDPDIIDGMFGKNEHKSASDPDIIDVRYVSMKKEGSVRGCVAKIAGVKT